MPLESREAWLARFASACDALLDTQQLSALSARLAEATVANPLIISNDRMLAATRQVGIYAGSFNPQTVAHAALAEAARVAAHLDTIVWTLARVTVDKEGVNRATLTDRVAQLEAYCHAAAPGDAVAVQDGGLYVEQAAAMRAWLGPHTTLWLIVGFDKVTQIFDPRYYDQRDAALERLFDAAGLLVAPREEHGSAELASLLGANENRRYAKHVRPFTIPEIARNVSSTRARRMMSGSRRVGDPFVDLGALVTPEGAALGMATDAYRERGKRRGAVRTDRYATRTAWLNVLSGWSESERPGEPLDVLVEATVAEDARGERLRRWLFRGDRKQTPKILGEILGLG